MLSSHECIFQLLQQVQEQPGRFRKEEQDSRNSSGARLSLSRQREDVNPSRRYSQQAWEEMSTVQERELELYNDH